MSRRKKPKLSAEEIGLRVVDLPRPRGDGAPESEPTVCPSCEQTFAEVSTIDEEMEVGDGVSYLNVEKRRGLCPSCGWIDL